MSAKVINNYVTNAIKVSENLQMALVTSQALGHTKPKYNLQQELIRKNWFLNLLTWAISTFLFECYIKILTILTIVFFLLFSADKTSPQMTARKLSGMMKT